MSSYVNFLSITQSLLLFIFYLDYCCISLVDTFDGLPNSIPAARASLLRKLVFNLEIKERALSLSGTDLGMSVCSMKCEGNPSGAIGKDWFLIKGTEKLLFISFPFFLTWMWMQCLVLWLPSCHHEVIRKRREREYTLVIQPFWSWYSFWLECAPSLHTVDSQSYLTCTLTVSPQRASPTSLTV